MFFSISFFFHISSGLVFNLRHFVFSSLPQANPNLLQKLTFSLLFFPSLPPFSPTHLPYHSPLTHQICPMQTHKISPVTYPSKLYAQLRRTAKWHHDQQQQDFQVQGFWIAGFVGFQYVVFLFLFFAGVDDHFGKPNRKKKPSNMGRKELVSGQKNH